MADRRSLPLWLIITPIALTVAVAVAAVALLFAQDPSRSAPLPEPVSAQATADDPIQAQTPAPLQLSNADVSYLNAVRSHAAFSSITDETLFNWARTICSQLKSGSDTVSVAPELFQASHADKTALIGAAFLSYCPTSSAGAPGGAPARSSGSSSDGTYLVGSDIAPGTYTTPGSPSGGQCYWKRLRNLNNDNHSIAGNDLFNGPGVVQVHGDDAAVKFSQGCAWTKK